MIPWWSHAGRVRGLMGKGDSLDIWVCCYGADSHVTGQLGNASGADEWCLTLEKRRRKEKCVQGYITLLFLFLKCTKCINFSHLLHISILYLSKARHMIVCFNENHSLRGSSLTLLCMILQRTGQNTVPLSYDWKGFSVIWCLVILIKMQLDLLFYSSKYKI